MSNEPPTAASPPWVSALEEVFQQAFPQLETERLILRDIRESDVDRIFRIRAHARVSEFIHRPLFAENDHALELIRKARGLFEQSQGIVWVGELRSTGQVVGAMGLRGLEIENGRAEIGGEMEPKWWGRGFPDEALKAVLDFAFQRMRLHAIEAKIDPNNRSVLHWLKRHDFEREGRFKRRVHFEGRFYDLDFYTRFGQS